MKLKSFGCSFIFGTDLPDDGRDGPIATASQYSWPALLAKNLGYEYQCYARPGSGNLQIYENLANQIATNEPCLYIIGWTWIDRFDYINANATNWRNGTRWKTIMPIDRNPVAEMYYRELHSEHLDKLKSLIYVKSALDLLLNNRCRFIMTSMDDLLLDQKWNRSACMIPVQNTLKPYLSWFDNKNFLHYSRDRGHAISATQHPLESAHADAANLVLNNFQDFIKGE